MASSGVQEGLNEVGKKLVTPLPEVPELLTLLDKTEEVLSAVTQAPARPIREALIPVMEGLIMPELVRHSDDEVKISVTTCISEVTRISAPDAPYEEEHMKEYFELAVAALKKLSHSDGRCYAKALAILCHIAKIRSSLVMLDLELNELIYQMFHLFLNETRAGHPSSVFDHMEAIMTLVIQEIDDISLDLIVPILTSLLKENQKIVPHSYKMGETVVKNCAGILKPHLLEGMQFMDMKEKDFSEIVSSVCQGTFRQELSVTEDAAPDGLPSSIKNNGSAEMKNTSHSGDELLHDQVLVERGHQVTGDTAPDALCSAGVGPSLDGLPSSTKNDGSAEMQTTSHLGDEQGCQMKSTTGGNMTGHDNSDTMKPKKRGRKPKSLMKPEGGCDHLLSEERKTSQLRGCRKNQEKRVGSSTSLVGKESGQSDPTKDQSSSQKMSHSESVDACPSQDKAFSDGTQHKRGVTSKSNVHDDKVTGDTTPDALCPAGVRPSLDGKPTSTKNDCSAEMKSTSHLGDEQGCQMKSTSGGNMTGQDNSDAVKPKRRGRKPKSLMEPEGECSHLLSQERKTPQLIGCSQNQEEKGKESGRSEQTKDQSSSPKMSHSESADACPSKDQKISDGTQRKRQLKKRTDLRDCASDEEVTRYLKANSRRRSGRSGFASKSNVRDDVVSGDTTPDVFFPVAVGPSLDGLPSSIKNDGSAEMNNTSHLGDEQSCQRKSTSAGNTTGHDHSDAMKPKKRGRKPKSLMKPEGGCDHFLSEERKTPQLTGCGQNQEKKVGSSTSAVGKESGRSEPTKDQSSSLKMFHSESADACPSQNQTFSDGTQRTHRQKKRTDLIDRASDEEVARYLKENSNKRSRKSGVTSKSNVHDEEVTGDTTPDVFSPGGVGLSLDGLHRSIKNNGSAEMKNTSNLGDELLCDQVSVERGHQVTGDTTPDVFSPGGVGLSLDGLSRSTKNDCSVEIKKTSHLGDEQGCQRKSTSGGNMTGHDNSDAMKPKKRGRKPKSLMKPEGGRDRLLSVERKTPQLTGCRQNQEKKVGSSTSLVGKESGRSEPTKDQSSSPKMFHSESADVCHGRSSKSGVTSKSNVHDDEVTGDQTTPDAFCPSGVGLSSDGIPISTKNDGSAEMMNTSHLGDEQGCQMKSTSGGNTTGHDNSDSMKPKKRGRKPKSLMKPEGGFNGLLSEEKIIPILRGCRTNQESRVGSSTSLVGKESGRSEPIKDQSSSPKMSHTESGDASASQDKTFSDETQRKRELKKKADLLDHAIDEQVTRYLNSNLGRRSRNSGVSQKSNAHNNEVAEFPSPGKSYGAELIGRAIQVWWPLDKAFYEGAVFSFDPIKRTHKVLYADGDEENLDLSQERWLLVPRMPSPEKQTSQKDQEMKVSPSESSSSNMQKMGNVKIEPESL